MLKWLFELSTRQNSGLRVWPATSDSSFCNKCITSLDDWFVNHMSPTQRIVIARGPLKIPSIIGAGGTSCKMDSSSETSLFYFFAQTGSSKKVAGAKKIYISAEWFTNFRLTFILLRGLSSATARKIDCFHDFFWTVTIRRSIWYSYDTLR